MEGGCRGGEGGRRQPGALVGLAREQVLRAPLTLRQVVASVHRGVTRLRHRGCNWGIKYFTSRCGGGSRALTHREPPAALRRHAIKTVQDYLASAPHLFQVVWRS